MSVLIRTALGAALVAALAGSPADAASSACAKAQRKVAKEERFTVSADATIERERKARAACPTPRACARYDERIRALEARKTRHGARLAKLRTEAAKTCASG